MQALGWCRQWDGEGQRAWSHPEQPLGPDPHPLHASPPGHGTWERATTPHLEKGTPAQPAVVAGLHSQGDGVDGDDADHERREFAAAQQPAQGGTELGVLSPVGNNGRAGGSSFSLLSFFVGFPVTYPSSETQLEILLLSKSTQAELDLN